MPVWLITLLKKLGASKVLKWVAKRVLKFLVNRGINIMWKFVDDDVLPDIKETMRQAGRDFSKKGRALVAKGKLDADEWERGEKRLEVINNDFWAGANEDD